MSLANAFARQSRGYIFAEMVAALFAIGALDQLTGFQIRLLPFYSAPVFVAAWFCGKNYGIAAGLLAGFISLTADWVDHDPDLQGWTRSWEIIRHLGSCLAVALVGLALRSKRDITEARIALLEHSQKLEDEIVRTTETEQRRIGQDLHDGICQHLAALACSATSLREDLEKRQLNAEAKMADELSDLLRDAVVQTRDLAHRLIPAQVAGVGLPLALQSLTESVGRLQGIQCTFECEGDMKAYPEEVAKHLYRIAQEAITNATKHGKARNIAVSLQATNGLTTLNIADDGMGFPKAATNGSGIGLQIMRHRARLNGGDLEILHRESGGTVIRCTAATP